METIAVGKHIYAKCKVCGRLRRLDKVSPNGICVTCWGVAFMEYAKRKGINLERAYKHITQN